MSEILPTCTTHLYDLSCNMLPPLLGPHTIKKIFQTQSCQMTNNNDNRSSVIAMLQYLGWWALEQRQAGGSPCLFYKIVINL